MNSLILQIASKYIRWILMIFAVLALLRGHNHPGGGFIGGLLGGLAFGFGSFAHSPAYVIDKMRLKPSYLAAIGLLVVLLSMLPSLISESQLMQGFWTTLRLPFEVNIKLGTPLLFDIGVFLAVMGVSLMFILNINPND
jgi:multicomponent Na+:H+ antiporter subunit B